MLESPAILIGGIFALVELVFAALLDFFKRDRRRYDILSRSGSQRLVRVFLTVTLIEWTVLIAMQLLLVPPVLGWPAFVICLAFKLVLLQKDFVRRRMDVPNGLFRVARYQFLSAILALVAISYYVHSRATAPADTAPAVTGARG